MPELTPRDDTKKMVSEILKRVDQFLKKGDLTKAALELSKAKELDARNVYVHAFEERITVLQEEATRNAAQAAQNKVEEEKHRKHQEQQDKEHREAEDERSKEELARAESEKSAHESLKARMEILETYRKLLTAAWANGAASESEEKEIRELRDALGIGVDEAEKMEQEVRRESFSRAYKKMRTSGSIQGTSSPALSELKKAFRISDEELLELEPEMLAGLKKDRKPTIVVIDDDHKLLSLLADTIRQAGYNAKAFSTSDEAYKFLRDTVPDLILCDINLETSTMGGFTFYEKIQEEDNLQEIPFIFLTGLTDEVLVRTGKELGVDDYLMKPVSEATLMATIKGKLKRYSQLKSKRSKRK